MDKVWLITGSTSGLGRNISTRSITANNFPPTSAQWVPRCHRFTERRATRCLDVRAESSTPGRLTDGARVESTRSAERSGGE